MEFTIGYVCGAVMMVVACAILRITRNTYPVVK